MIPPGEHIAETKICRLSGKEFVATNKDLEHIEKVSPTYNKKKFLIPSPDLCPAERQRNRLCFRNERCFYHRKCSFSRQPIVSIYSPDKPDLVYEQKIWWSDEWSPFDYGVDFDFDRPFFDQFADLLVRVPKLAMINAKSENATYTNYSTENKDCYQSVGIGWSENVYHSYRVLRCEHIFDCYDMFESRDCYECLESKGLMFCYWCKDCHSSSDLLLCYDCQNCDHCIGCTNLRGKSYWINNQASTREEYEKQREQLITKDIKQHLSQMAARSFVRDCSYVRCEQCLGDNLINCRNCVHSYAIKDCEFCRYNQLGTGNKECMDNEFFDGCELQYFACNLHDNYMTALSALIWYCQNTYYSYSCFNSQNLLGSVGLKKGENVIFNIMYSKQEFEELAQRIVQHMQSTGEWGHMFPLKTSPFAYNESTSYEYYPLSKDEVLARGWKWKEEEKVDKVDTPYAPQPTEAYDETKVGEQQARENIQKCLEGTLECSVTGKGFRLSKPELSFHIRNHIPVPTKHPDVRHAQRMSLRNPRKLFERVCDQCGEMVYTPYDEGRLERVLCEGCYLKEVY